MELDCTNCCRRTTAIDAAVYVAHGFWAMGNETWYSKFLSLAQRLWLMSNGEERGFADKNGRFEN